MTGRYRKQFERAHGWRGRGVARHRPRQHQGDGQASSPMRVAATMALPA